MPRRYEHLQTSTPDAARCEPARDLMELIEAEARLLATAPRSRLERADSRLDTANGEEETAESCSTCGQSWG